MSSTSVLIQRSAVPVTALPSSLQGAYCMPGDPRYSRSFFLEHATTTLVRAVLRRNNPFAICNSITRSRGSRCQPYCPAWSINLTPSSPQQCGASHPGMPLRVLILRQLRSEAGLHHVELLEREGDCVCWERVLEGSDSMLFQSFVAALQDRQFDSATHHALYLRDGRFGVTKLCTTLRLPGLLSFSPLLFAACGR